MPARFTGSDVAVLKEDFGGPPVSGLTRVQTVVLKAVADAPLGVLSARTVARRSGISPTSAGKALKELADAGLVTRTNEKTFLGKVVDATVYRAAVCDRRWPGIASALSAVDLPSRVRKSRPPAKKVPHYLRHLFWNTAESQLDVASSANYIARRILSSGDIQGLAWAARNLPVSAWEHASRTRGIRPDYKALALNVVARKGRDAAG